MEYKMREDGTAGVPSSLYSYLFPYPPEALREGILRIFADLAGELPTPGKRYYVERFAKTHVGMSTGWLSGDFWLDTAIPLRMERLERANRLTDNGTEEVWR